MKAKLIRRQHLQIILIAKNVSGVFIGVIVRILMETFYQFLGFLSVILKTKKHKSTLNNKWSGRQDLQINQHGFIVRQLCSLCSLMMLLLRIYLLSWKLRKRNDPKDNIYKPAKFCWDHKSILYTIEMIALKWRFFLPFFVF